jgi:hypothetical protein
MIHIDVKKLGRIPPAGVADPRPGRKEEQKKSVPTGYAFLHSTIDDHSRVVYSEILGDEKGDHGSILVQSKCLLRVARDHRETGPIG